MALHFLIIDGYPKESREKFKRTGVNLAWKQYAAMLQSHLPEASYDVLLPSDDDAEIPQDTGLSSYQGVMWTGCNLTIFHHDDPRVQRMIELGRLIYQVGVPSFGTCWGLQMAAVAAGGAVTVNPKGREMGVARKIHLTPEGREHPFYREKPEVFDGFISHYDEVTTLPPGARWLATNDFTRIQALEVTHKKGTFWALQYHPEYDLHEMARLLVAREERMLNEGFFQNHDELAGLVERLEALHREPGRKDLRWQLGIDDDLLDPKVRQCEVKNWIEQLVIPTAGKR
jgi:GMP synthase (glutamine-hydrolysing)